jgi:hypothetical protein
MMGGIIHTSFLKGPFAYPDIRLGFSHLKVGFPSF